MLDYLRDILGLDSHIKSINPALPWLNFLPSADNYKLLEIENQPCLVIPVSANSFSVSAFKKQQLKLAKDVDYPIVLELNSLTPYQRKTLIENKISFIIPGYQVYLPFMALTLQEYDKKIPWKENKLTSMAQIVFLYFYYQTDDLERYKTEIARELDTSNMTVTRGVQDLEILKLVKSQKKGRLSCVSRRYPRKDYLEKGLPYMVSPIRRKVYVKPTDFYEELPLAGMEAAARLLPRHKIDFMPTRALWRRQFSKTHKKDVINPDTYQRDYIILELWDYNPQIFADSETNAVDMVSLIVSLQHSEDITKNSVADELLKLL